MQPLIKVCGMTDATNIRAVEALGVDWMGFVFYARSPRCVTRLPDYLPNRARRVGVFVNRPMEEVIEIARQYRLDYLQLHGKESPAYCHRLKERGYKLIKAFSIAQKEDFPEADTYEADYYLFDTKTIGYGGSGRQFDWQLLDHYHGTTPFLLSGGIGPDTAEPVSSFRHPLWAGIDLNSKFEIRPGLKDVDKLRTFITQFKEKVIL